MTQYAYCGVCKKEVDQPTRKPLETFQKVIWVIVIIGTIGIAALVFAIYYTNRPKKYCPTCYSELKFSEEPFKKEEEEEEEEGIPLTPKEKVIKKAKKKSKAKKKVRAKPIEKVEDTERGPVDKTFCPYCGEDVEPDAIKCPYCHSTLKAPYEK